MSDLVELKPCPFCGSDELSHGWSAPGYDGSMSTGNVECHSCNALVYANGGESDAIAAWNARAEADRITALEAACREKDEQLTRERQTSELAYEKWQSASRERDQLRAKLDEAVALLKQIKDSDEASIREMAALGIDLPDSSSAFAQEIGAFLASAPQPTPPASEEG